MNQPLVTIIVPVYKVEKYLRRCLDSIAAQTYTNFEAILVDDGSPDRCGEICDEYAAKDTRFRVIHQKMGVGLARNMGLKNYHGNYIMFVDSDDYLECNMCEELLAAIRKENSDIAVCGFFIDEDGGSSKNRGPAQTEVLSGKNSVIRYFAGNGTNYLAVVWNKLYDKKVFDENHKIQFPVGMRYEDEFVSYKLLYHANQVVFITVPLYHYVQHAESFMHTLGVGDMMARKTCLMEYYRWAEEEAPDMKKLIEYAGIRIFTDLYGVMYNMGDPVN